MTVTARPLVRVLLFRLAGEDGISAAIPLPRGVDPVQLAGTLCRLTEPDHHAGTEWCVVEAESAIRAVWPDPEPWAGPADCHTQPL